LAIVKAGGLLWPQGPSNRVHTRMLFKNLIYGAIIEQSGSKRQSTSTTPAWLPWLRSCCLEEQGGRRRCTLPGPS
jgi:hypothetical protein